MDDKLNMIIKDQLKHLSKLSKIELTENEFETYTTQIEKIIKYLDKLDEISLNEDESSLSSPSISLTKLSDLREDTIIEPDIKIDKVSKHLKDKFVKGPVMG
jgi:aspartyl-tRNA(Asn)/glutamyl-tRNA(Gln) amidotransferase subunit C